jgi:VCBS repeat protein
MRSALTVLLAIALVPSPARSPDIPFKTIMIDNGASETTAVADVNKDGKLDIISGENWYEGPSWTKHKFRELNFTNNYYDNFSDLPVDVDGDGYPDLVRVTWFAKKISWWKNPGRASSSPWQEADIHTGFNIEFAVLADMDNDGKANEVVAQENGTPQAWYEVKNGAWVAHEVSDKSYGHGIGAGDVNGDKRTDILTPRGWLEAPADPRQGNWTLHADWEAINVPLPVAGQPPPDARSAGASAPASRVLELGFMHVMDVNGEGRNDVIAGAGHNYGLFWFEQGKDGQFTRRTIDASWSQAHASTIVDLNGDGRMDIVTGKRFMAHNGSDPGEKEPLGVYWYEFVRPTAGSVAGGQPASVEWIKHVIDYGGRMGGGMQIPVIDIDGDGDLDIVCAGKSGLFFVENLTKGKH